MATKKGVWNLQQVRDKKLQNLWDYTNTANLYTWGRNEHGQLGLNQAPSLAISSPTQVPGSWSINDGMTLSGRKVSARDWVLNIKSDGTLWGWGLNNKGQLGQGATANSSSPIQIGSESTWSCLGDFQHYAVASATKTDGTLWFWGDGDSKHQYGAVVDRSSPTQVPGTTWLSSFTGYTNSGALKNDGTLWTWGNNGYGQLGHGDKVDTQYPTQVGSDSTWVSATGGYNYNFGLKNDGTLWFWGENDKGSSGTNQAANVQYSSPIQIPGTTWTQKISSNQTVTLAIKNDNTLWAWGENEHGSLGQNNVVYRSSPTQIPGTTWQYVAVGNRYQSFAIKTDGTLWSWGNNRYGSLGQNTNGTDNTRYSSPVQIPGTWETVIAAGTDNGGVALKN